jgi:hypothetical protein
VYNTVLRRFPAKVFEIFRAGGNLFPTTIFVLVSAVIKIARVMRLPPGLELFRGLGGLTHLPESFLRDDEHGCKGYMEWGFLSTTASREAAIEYSGVGEGKPLPMVIQTRVSSIDRGACIKELSQYPGEVHAPLYLIFLLARDLSPSQGWRSFHFSHGVHEFRGLSCIWARLIHVSPGRVPLAALLISGAKRAFIPGGGCWIVPDDAACKH